MSVESWDPPHYLEVACGICGEAVRLGPSEADDLALRAECRVHGVVAILSSPRAAGVTSTLMIAPRKPR